MRKLHKPAARITERILCIAAGMLLLSAMSLAQARDCQQATDLFRAGRWRDAAKAFDECEEAAPGKTDALLYRAKALVNLRDFAAAGSSLESYVSKHPASDDALYLLGYVQFRQDHPRDSLQTFNIAAKVREPQADDLKIAALDYVLLNDYNSAARYLEQSLQMNPEDAEARYHLGRVRYQQNHFDEAIAAFEEVLRQDPANVKARDNLGLCLEAKNRNEEALAAYRKAIEIESSAQTARSAQPYIDAGKLLNTLNRAAEAAPLLSQAVTIQPGSAPAQYELGRARFLLGHLEEARVHLEKAAALDPKSSAQHYLLGRVYARLGKSQEAAAEFKMTEELIHQQNGKSGGMASRR
jgi:tetratricopeptide (TPR) repeat protein